MEKTIYKSKKGNFKMSLISALVFGLIFDDRNSSYLALGFIAIEIKTKKIADAISVLTGSYKAEKIKL